MRRNLMIALGVVLVMLAGGWEVSGRKFDPGSGTLISATVRAVCATVEVSP